MKIIRPMIAPFQISCFGNNHIYDQWAGKPETETVNRATFVAVILLKLMIELGDKISFISFKDTLTTAPAGDLNEQAESVMGVGKWLVF